MKTTLTTIAALILVLTGYTPQAEARGYRSSVYVSSYQPCGTPIYRERYVVRVDRWSNPVWASRPCRVPYRPVYRPAHRPDCRTVYVFPCPPPRPVPYYRPGYQDHVVWTR